jgi:hypothetical protein
MKDGMDVGVVVPSWTHGLKSWNSQIAISAGHEFIVSTDPKYQEICDDKIMWMDYVRSFLTLAFEVLLTSVASAGQPPQGNCTRETHLCRRW